MTGVKEVAERAGVSVGTVSNVLNRRDFVAPEYVERVMRAVEELGFVRNDAARTLRSGRSHVIGLLIPEGENPFFADIARGAGDAAQNGDVVVLTGNTHGDAEREAFYLDVFTEQRVRGLIIAPLSDVNDRLEKLRRRGTPSVVLRPYNARPSSSTISVNNAAGGRLAARHLAESHRRRLAFVGGPLALPEIAQRLDGARGEAKSFASVEVLETGDTTLESGLAVGEAIARRQPDDRPDAVFAANDLIALGVLNALVVRGISVPEDIAIVGFDDIALARTAICPLTTIRQSGEEMGATAVTILNEELSGPIPPRHLLLEPKLVVRLSA